MDNVTQPRRHRKPLQPVTGTCRRLGDGRLSITVTRQDGKELTETYELAENRHDGQLLGVRLTKPDGSGYDVGIAAVCWTCTCGDYVYRRAEAQTPELREC